MNPKKEKEIINNMKKLLRKLLDYLNKPSTPRYTYTVNWVDRSFELKEDQKKINK